MCAVLSSTTCGELDTRIPRAVQAATSMPSYPAPAKFVGLSFDAARRLGSREGLGGRTSVTDELDAFGERLDELLVELARGKAGRCPVADGYHTV